ncbi:MAG: pilus assembly PilX N-terminal domain-containing protein [Parcubacteria group bacterium]|jgi:hypothetical protein
MKNKLGSALILTTILLFVILGMVVSLTYVTVMEQKMSGKTKSSVGSFYSAESGIEWILNKLASNSGQINDSLTMNSDFTISCPASFGADSCKIYLLDKDGKIIEDAASDLSEVKAVRSVGSQGNETQRAIEAAVASGGGGCYVDYALGAGLSIGSPCKASGFIIKSSAGKWGYCGCRNSYWYSFMRPAGGSCPSAGQYIDGCGATANVDVGEAYVCCQS